MTVRNLELAARDCYRDSRQHQREFCARACDVRQVHGHVEGWQYNGADIQLLRLEDNDSKLVNRWLIRPSLTKAYTQLFAGYAREDGTAEQEQNHTRRSSSMYSGPTRNALKDINVDSITTL